MAMSFFISREEAAAWFSAETRELTLPDGATRRHTERRSIWRSFDYVVACGLFTGEEIAGLVAMTAAERGESFEVACREVIAYIHREYLKSLDWAACAPKPSGHLPVH